jgi:hypothetical protein
MNEPVGDVSGFPTVEESTTIYLGVVDSLKKGCHHVRELSSDTERSNAIRCQLLQRQAGSVVSFSDIMTARLQYDVPGLFLIHGNAEVAVSLKVRQKPSFDRQNLSDSVDIMKFNLTAVERTFFRCLPLTTLVALHGVKDLRSLNSSNDLPNFNDRLSIMKSAVAIRIARNRVNSVSNGKHILKVTSIDAEDASILEMSEARKIMKNGRASTQHVSAVSLATKSLTTMRQSNLDCPHTTQSTTTRWLATT